MKKIIVSLFILAASLLPAAFSARADESRPAAGLNAGADYRRASGAERLTDIGSLSAFIQMTQPLNSRFSLSTVGTADRYFFSSGGGLSGRGAGLGLDYRGPSMDFGGSFLYRDLGGAAPRSDYTVHYGIKMLNGVNLRLAYGNLNRSVNFDTLRTPLGDRYFDAKAAYRVSGGVTLGCDFRKGDLTDGNAYRYEGLEAKITSAKKPSFFASLRMERQMYDKVSAKYYSPTDYTTFSGTVGYSNAVAAKGLKGLHYAIALKATDDSNGQFAVVPEASVSVDINKSLSASVRYGQTYAPYLSDTSTTVALTYKP